MNQVETTKRRQVVLCDQDGEPTGCSEILAAHQGEGRLHKAFSVFVFRHTDQGPEILIQQRSADKLLFAGYWANTCCSHPSPADADICQAGQVRLEQECGFSVPLQAVGSFVYQASDPRGRGAEYEHDTVLVGRASADIEVNVDPSEIADYKWVTTRQLKDLLRQDAASFAPWFEPALEHALTGVEDSAPDA
jgi:isopentenyl-diphosphate delta-isomerase